MPKDADATAVDRPVGSQAPSPPRDRNDQASMTKSSTNERMTNGDFRVVIGAWLLVLGH
jgi:hypothetical protein